VPIAHVNGTRLNYVQMGSEDGCAQEDLVMVHGLATNMAFWYFHYAPQLAKRFRVTLFDLRGHGRSDMPERGYTPQDLAIDLQGLLDHLGIKKAHFLAHSFGGVAVMNLACFDPARISSLILADTHISAVRRVDGMEWGHGQEIQAILDENGLALDTRDPYFGYKLLTEVAHLQLKSAEVPPALLDLVSPLIGKYGNRTASQWLKLMDTTQAERELMGDDGLAIEKLRKFSFPILAMYGDKSQARLTGKELLEVWPHAEFRRVRDAGHFFPASRPEEVIHGCERFWGGEFEDKPKHRVGEARKSYFRSDRVFESGGEWYCLTREKTRIGPFARQEEVREYLASYISTMATVTES